MTITMMWQLHALITTCGLPLDRHGNRKNALPQGVAFSNLHVRLTLPSKPSG